MIRIYAALGLRLPAASDFHLRSTERGAVAKPDGGQTAQTPWQATWIVLVACGALTCSTPTARAQQTDAKEGRAPRPSWEHQDTSDVFFADAVQEAFGGQWPPEWIGPMAAGESGAADAKAGRSGTAERKFDWSRAVDGELLVDEIKRLAMVLKQATRSNQTWIAYGGDKLQSDLATLSVLFGVIAEWEADIRFKSDAQSIGSLVSDAAGNVADAPGSARTIARSVSHSLQDLIEGNRITGLNSHQLPVDWGTTVDRTQLMGRLEEAIEQNLDGGLQSPNRMSSRRQELSREANLSTIIFGALTREGCKDADQPAYAAYCRSAARDSVALRRAIADNQFEKARSALIRIRRVCDECHEGFRY